MADELINVEQTPEVTEPKEEETNTELASLRAEMARQKLALDKATKEAADYKKQLRAKQSAEEVAAEEQRIQSEARDQELNELRRRFAVSENTKKIMTFVGNDTQAGDIAKFLYGAEDVDAAIDLLNKAWQAKEKALRIEYGKIPAPSVGSSEGSTVTKAQLDAMGYKERNEFATRYPNDYARLMGRA